MEKMKRVLLFDNDEEVLDVMKEALNYEGFDVCGISETDDIFTVIADYQPDLVILDYLLTGINGGEICHQIKTSQKTAGLPVMLISAYPKVLLSLGDYGCDDFIPKPFDLTDLINRIQKLTMKPVDTEAG